MIRQIVLTEEEYDELLKVKEKPNDQLRATNKALAEKYDQLKTDKINVKLSDFKSPFKVEDNILDFTTKGDFVSFYNNIVIKQDSNRPSLMKIDLEVFEFIKNLAEVWSFDLPFKDVKVLKTYRVTLVKSGLYTLNRNNTLSKVEKNL